MADVGEPPPLVGGKLLRFIAVMLGWSLMVALAAAWWWAIAPLPNGCANSAAAQHIVAEREGIGGECTQAAIDRTKTTVRTTPLAWTVGTVAIAVINWVEPWRRTPAGDHLSPISRREPPGSPRPM